ncbi:MAG: hypothetical protein RDV48_21945 [Candidatus Eremiobacteraeota bacterium]|nr:hypothetical protein [Candidatus Eremiobacteraeota bacterium]
MRLLGIALSCAGFLLLAMSLLADSLGIGAAPLFFGWKQVAGVICGTIIFLLGFILSLPGKEEQDSDPPPPPSNAP